jgi:hypothetical protein
MIDVMTRLAEVKLRTAEALRAVEKDPGASVVLAAVVREFDSDAEKARWLADGNGSARDALIELEQAADSARTAAEADRGLHHSVRQAVVDAYVATSRLKAEVIAVCILTTTG